MNLMKFFNRNYMIENLKKSKAVLAFLIGIVPIVSTFIYFALRNQNNILIVQLESISAVHYVGIFLIPLLLSISLFDYVYKKRSVDFIGSMPLSRKTIFITNTIAGSLLLMAMVLLSAFGIWLINLLMDFILPGRMLLDYIVVWTCTYLFCFILANLAMSISGNKITQVIVTILLFFLLPFLLQFSYMKLNPRYGTGYYPITIQEENQQETQLNSYLGTSVEHLNLTTPYRMIGENLFGTSFQLWDVIATWKMVILSIGGFFLGLFFFQKRKMEHNEITFSSLRIHNFVKTLTLIPVAVVLGNLAIETNSTTLKVGFLLILLGYYYIYDLLTRRTLADWKKTLIHFCISIIFLFPLAILLDVGNRNNREEVILKEDIKGYQLSLNTEDVNPINYVEVQNQETIDMITSMLEKGNQTGIQHQVILKTKEKEYRILAYWNKEDFTKVREQIEKTEKVPNPNSLLLKNKMYAFSFSFEYGDLEFVTDNAKILEEAKKSLLKNRSCDTKYKLNQKGYLYAYSQGRNQAIVVDSCTSSILSDYVQDIYEKESQKVAQKLKKLTRTQLKEKNMTILLNSYYMIEDHSNMDYNHFFSTISFYQKENEIIQFMRKYDQDSFDITKSYIGITGYLDGTPYLYYTNRTEEFIDMFDDLLEVDTNDIN